MIFVTKNVFNKALFYSTFFPNSWPFFPLVERNLGCPNNRQGRIQLAKTHSLSRSLITFDKYPISFSSLCTPTKDSEPLLKNGTPQNGQSKSSFGVADNNGGMKGQQQPRQQSRSEKAKIGDADEPKKKQGCCALMWN